MSGLSTPPRRRDMDAAWQREVESLSEYKAMKEPYAGLVRSAFERGYLARCFAPSETGTPGDVTRASLLEANAKQAQHIFEQNHDIAELQRDLGLERESHTVTKRMLESAVEHSSAKTTTVGELVQEAAVIAGVNLRNEVLEEAADLCDRHLDQFSGTECTYRTDVAQAIRGLKHE